jgi:hypothetical protein
VATAARRTSSRVSWQGGKALPRQTTGWLAGSGHHTRRNWAPTGRRVQVRGGAALGHVEALAVVLE